LLVEKIDIDNLVKLSQKGDQNAFRILYQQYQKKVRSTLYQLCGIEYLDDLVQEVFLRVWKALPKLKNPSTFSTWLYRITWNVATDQRRKYALDPIQPMTAKDEENLNLTPSIPQDSSDLIQLHYQDLVAQALKQLSLNHRIILVLHDLEDVSQKEISKILGIPTGTVKSRLFYARNALRQYFTAKGVYL
jgi:RNA polymerase sigma-70 factor, ECF subfamily